MVNSPTENVKLTFEQLQQNEMAKKMLGNLETEIVNAQKNLKITKLQFEQALKDVAYQHELLDEVLPKVEKAKASLEDIHNQIAEAKTILDNCLKETALLNESNVAKDREIREKSEKLALEQQEHVKKVEEHTTNSHELLKEKERIENAKAILSAAIAAIT